MPGAAGNPTVRASLGALLALCSSLALPAAPARAAPAFELSAVRGVLQRVLPAQAAQFELATLAASPGHERFRIAGVAGRIQVAGSTPSAVLFGVNWYLKYVAQLQVSSAGDQLQHAGALPAPPAPIELETPYRYR